MRILLSPGEWRPGERVALDEEETHHLKVRRAREGEMVEILDGVGARGAGVLVRSGRRWEVEVRSVAHEEPVPRLVLAVAAGDRQRFSWMVEKLVELGVTGIVPLETERSSGVATRLKDVHLQRLRRAVLEAIKQCGATWAPLVEEPLSLAAFLDRPLDGIGWLADAGGSPPSVGLGSLGLTALVGPEGGLTQAERALAIAAGYQPIALGPHTLRFETAALAAAAAATQARMRSEHG